MALMGSGGYFVARDVLAPKILQPNQVHGNRPQPVRVLTPDEAVSAAREEPSRVWTDDTVAIPNAAAVPLKTKHPKKPNAKKPAAPVTTTPDITTNTPSTENIPLDTDGGDNTPSDTNSAPAETPPPDGNLSPD